MATPRLPWLAAGCAILGALIACTPADRPAPAPAAQPPPAAPVADDAGLRRRQAVNAVIREVAAAQRAAGNEARAAALEADVARAPDSLPLGVEPAHSLLPPFSGEAAVREAFAGDLAAALARPDPVALPLAGKPPFPDVGSSRINGTLLFNYLVACAHPDSPRYGDREAFTRMLRRTAVFIEALASAPADKHVGEFFTLEHNLFAILCLSRAYPDLLLPSQRTALDAGVRVHGERLVAEQAAGKLGWWCNSHISYAAALIYGGLLIGEPRYVETGRAIIAHHVGTQYPDGAFPYVTGQNESEGYHAIMPATFHRVWLATGDETARQGILRSASYTPLSVEPPIVGTFATSPAWKSTWNTSYATSPEAAWHARSPWLKTYQLVRRSYHRAGANDWSAWPVLLDLANVPARPLPDRYTVYDANLQGPRTRYGGFSAMSTLRSTSTPLGLPTLVACLSVDGYAPTKPLPLNAALGGVFAGPRLRPGDTFSATATLAEDCRGSAMLGRDCAAVTASYGLGGQAAGLRRLPSTWRGEQQWVLLPDRMVGVIAVLPGDEPAYEVAARLRLLHGGAGVMYPKKLVEVDASTWTYGSLRVQVHAQDFGSVSIQRDVPMWRDDRRGATDLRFGDEPTATPHALPGLRHAVVEIGVAGDAPAAVTRIVDGPLHGLAVEHAGRRYVALMNTGGEALAVDATRHALPGAQPWILRPFQPGGANRPEAAARIALAPDAGVLIVSGGAQTEPAPWPGITALLEAHAAGTSGLPDYALPGLDYR